MLIHIYILLTFAYIHIYIYLGLKRNEFAKHIEVLNKQFYDYISQLKDRYMREVGCIMTFGSGDCGQLAHGVERDEDLMCKYPRMVSSMQQYRVSSVACGGLHNAIVTADGLVFTWGCSDDGSLGR